MSGGDPKYLTRRVHESEVFKRTMCSPLHIFFSDFSAVPVLLGTGFDPWCLVPVLGNPYFGSYFRREMIIFFMFRVPGIHSDTTR